MQYASTPTAALTAPVFLATLVTALTALVRLLLLMAMFSITTWGRSFCFMHMFLYASTNFMFLVVLGCSFQMCAAVDLTLLSWLAKVDLLWVIIGASFVRVFLVAL